MGIAWVLPALCLAAAPAAAVVSSLGARRALERLAEPAREEGAKRFRGVLPAPLRGWGAEEPEAGSGPAALLGGGPSASRRYFADGPSERTVDVEVVADSPLADSLAPLLADPALVAQTPGSAVIEIRGRKALRRLAPDDRTAELSLVLKPRGLVVVRGLGVDGADEVTAYAEALDWEGLEALLRP